MGPRGEFGKVNLRLWQYCRREKDPSKEPYDELPDDENAGTKADEASFWGSVIAWASSS